jgi:hypothetical protein
LLALGKQPESIRTAQNPEAVQNHSSKPLYPTPLRVLSNPSNPPFLINSAH